MSIRDTFLRSGIDLTVTHDDTLNDADSADTGTNWSEAELHDLMEDRFDSFSDRLQWNLYGVIVPRFGDPSYNSGYYGTMFDWGGWQVGDSFLRQGFAIADDATRGRTSGTLYDTAVEEDRLVLQTLIHEAGHAFNLPHTWDRTVNDDSGSESFMNYPWGYTDNGGGETNFWSNFRWEFDDVELIWMRHADRNDVIFGGRDWIGDNLSVDLGPAFCRQLAGHPRDHEPAGVRHRCPRESRAEAAEHFRPADRGRRATPARGWPDPGRHRATQWRDRHLPSSRAASLGPSRANGIAARRGGVRQHRDQLRGQGAPFRRAR